MFPIRIPAGLEHKGVRTSVCSRRGGCGEDEPYGWSIVPQAHRMGTREEDECKGRYSGRMLRLEMFILKSCLKLMFQFPWRSKKKKTLFIFLILEETVLSL